MSTENLTAQAARDIATNVAGGTVLAGFLGFFVWMRKLVGLPKRVRTLETTQAVVLATNSAQTKALLAMLNSRRSDDDNEDVERAKQALREADEQMESHLRDVVTGTGK